jgi:Ca2+-transporting ATPase
MNVHSFVSASERATAAEHPAFGQQAATEEQTLAAPAGAVPGQQAVLPGCSLTGLAAAEVLALRAEHGRNELPAEKPTSPWAILFSQFKSPLVYIILVAAAVSLLAAEYGDFIIIMIVVLADVALGFAQEYQAQRTYTALQSLLIPTTTVIRDGRRQEVELWELVPGDLVLLNAGERVPGDGYLLEAARLTVDEAVLTGESEPVSKSGVVGEPATAAEALPANLVFMGATVLTGRGTLRVTRTGRQTELGQIAASLAEHAEEETPLQRRLKGFSRTLTYLVVALTAAILVTGLLTGRPFLDMLRTAIILAIAAVPEGLLIAVTVILVLGMRKILKRSGLVKKLLAVETLGSVTIICTDKTGTLTEGRMRVSRAELADRGRALETMVLCNNLEGPVDVALWEYANAQLNSVGQRQDGSSATPQDLVDGSVRLAEEVFSSETKFMSTAVRLDNESIDYLKGAPEIVLDMCRTTPVERAGMLAQVDAWAGEGLRTLGLACRPHGDLDDRCGYIWVGLVGMQDPLREGVVEAVAVAQGAGIGVTMITGDYRRTAERIAANTGIWRAGDAVLEGEALARLTDAELRAAVRRTSVFSRIRPNDKLRIVQALQAEGDVVAMIGDGVNDAPALKRANIGVVVGSATDVARETADLILLDSNFSTVVAAVEEGRVIFENIRKVVAYVLSNSFAEVLAIFGAMLLGWPAPLLVAQILWIHLICDGPADIVLGFEPKEEGIMAEKPRSLQEPILAPLGLALIGIISTASALGALALFGHFYHVHGNPVEGRSIVFASFAVNSMIYIFGYRSLRRSLFRMAPLGQNKVLVAAVAAGLLMAILPFVVPVIGRASEVVPLTLAEWGLVAGIALALLAVVEIGKAITRRSQHCRSARQVDGVESKDPAVRG